MVIYEVSIAVDHEIAQDYRQWLVEHVQELLALPGFVSAEISEVEAPAAEDGREAFCVHYRLASHADLEEYLEKHAAKMRGRAEERFGGRFAAARRVLVRSHQVLAPVPEDRE